MFDYSKLKGRIVEKFGTRTEFADRINRTKGYVSMVLNKRQYLKQPEIQEWSNALDIPQEEISAYFFTREVHETEHKEEPCRHS